MTSDELCNLINKLIADEHKDDKEYILSDMVERYKEIEDYGINPKSIEDILYLLKCGNEHDICSELRFCGLGEACGKAEEGEK